MLVATTVEEDRGLPPVGPAHGEPADDGAPHRAPPGCGGRPASSSPSILWPRSLPQDGDLPRFARSAEDDIAVPDVSPDFAAGEGPSVSADGHPPIDPPGGTP